MLTGTTSELLAEPLVGWATILKYAIAARNRGILFIAAPTTANNDAGYP